MLTVAEITDVASVAEMALIARCAIVRDTRTDDDAGGWTRTPQTVASDIPCAVTTPRMQPAEGPVVRSLEGQRLVEVYLERTRAVAMGDRIVSDGVTYEVVGPPVLATHHPLLRVPCAIYAPRGTS